jgi:hypothetical protein
MAFHYGDAVVLVQKSPAGIIRRVNALVVASSTSTNDAPLRTPARLALPAGEYLDVFFPRTFPEGQEPKARTADIVFQFAGVVPPWKDGAFIGWEYPKDKNVKLKSFLMANFKDETGDETPEDCAVRLLGKAKKK